MNQENRYAVHFDELVVTRANRLKPQRPKVLEKGEAAGHPFRGNQYTGGRGDSESTGSYRGSHQPDTESDAVRFYELDRAMPDFYSRPKDYLWDSDGHYGSKEALAAAKSAKGKPDAPVRIYRAVPKGVKTINPKDWVTTSRRYAEVHAESHADAGQPMEVISAITQAKHISFGGNDAFEFGYLGSEPLKNLVAKGDYEGHPFRGNQWAKGRSSSSIPVSFTTPNNNPDFVNIQYGDFSFSAWSGGLDASDEDFWSQSLKEWEVWEGNFRMRHASAAIMGLSSPIAEGGSKGNRGANEIISTGKVPKEVTGSKLETHRITEAKDAAQESIMNSYVALSRIANSEEPTELPLHRGMSVEPNAKILSVKEGEEFAMPLTAFSYSSQTAMGFTGGDIGYGEDKVTIPTEGRTPVMITLRRGAKVADSDYPVEIQDPRTGDTIRMPIESLTQGKFRVSGVSSQVFPDGRKGKVIAIEQTEVFDPASNKFVEKSDEEIPDWVWDLGGSFMGTSKIKRK